MLRLGKKYDILMAKENAIWRIHCESPAQLDAWDEIDNEVTKIEQRTGIVVDLLNLAYECGVLSSIPIIAFCCLRSWTLVGLCVTLIFLCLSVFSRNNSSPELNAAINRS